MSAIHFDLTKVAVMAGLLCVAGCQSLQITQLTPEEVKERKAFTSGFRNALTRNAYVASRGLLDGDVKLIVKINRRNEVISCEAEPHSPGGTPAPVDPRLPALVKDVCWSTLYPLAPDKFFNSDGVVEIAVPLLFSSDEGAEESSPQLMAYVTRYEQSRFFWEQTLRNQSVSSIGYADFRYIANAQGQVEGCVVNLGASRQRPDAFKPDGDLQARLNGQCKQMNLRQLPGFKVNPQGVAEGVVRVEYMPWKGGPQAL